jgi:hypothetical protein
MGNCGCILSGVVLNLKRIATILAMGVAGVVSAGSQANAIVYTLSNVLLSDGGVLNGTIDIQFGGLLNYNLVTTGGNPALDTAYPFPSNPASNANPFGSPTVLSFFPTPLSYTAGLTLVFSSDLMIPGVHTLLGGVNGPSFECNNSFLCAAGTPNGTIRYIAGNYVFDGPDNTNGPATTPIPGAAWLMGTVLGGAGFGAWRRRRKAKLA